MNAILVVAEGMGSMASANHDVEKTTTFDLIQLIPTALNLTLAYLSKLQKAHLEYFIAVESITQKPSEAATASADYAKYQELSSEMSQATQKQNILVESEKSELTNLEEASPYKIMNSFENIEKSISNILSRG